MNAIKQSSPSNKENQQSLNASSTTQLNSTITDSLVTTPTTTPIPPIPIKQVKQFFMDGIVLTEAGHKNIKSQYPEQPKKSRAKRSNKDVQIANALDEALNDETNSQDDSKMDKEKKRQRKANKVGIGGFMVKQRQSRKDDESNNNNNSSINNLINEELTNDGDSNSFEKPAKRKRSKKKKGQQLQDAYPVYLREGFFGKELLEQSKERLAASDAIDQMDINKPQLFRFAQFSNDKIIGLMSSDLTSANSNLPANNSSTSNNNNNPIVNENSNNQNNQQPITTSSQPIQHHQSNVVDADLNKAIEETLESDDIGFKYQLDLPDDELLQILNMDTDDLNVPSNQNSNTNQDSFNFLNNNNLNNQLPPQQQPPPPLQQPQAAKLVETSSFSNDSFSSTNSSFTTAANNQNIELFTEPDEESGEKSTGKQQTNKNDIFYKWQQDEQLGLQATTASVLYANTEHPNIRLEFPNWPDRLKQIKKQWRMLLKNKEKRTFYTEKAKDNRVKAKAQRELIKSQQQSTPTSSDEQFLLPNSHLVNNEVPQSSSNLTGDLSQQLTPQQQMNNNNNNRFSSTHQINNPMNPTMIQVSRVRPPIDTTRINLPNANKVQSPRSQTSTQDLSSFSTNSPFSPQTGKSINDSLSNDPFPSSPITATNRVLSRQDSFNPELTNPLTPNSDISSPYSRPPHTPLNSQSQQPQQDSLQQQDNIYSQQPMTPVDNRPRQQQQINSAMQQDPYARPPLTPRPSHDPFSFHNATNNRVVSQQQTQFAINSTNQRSPSSSFIQQTSSPNVASPDPYSQQPVTPMPMQQQTEHHSSNLDMNSMSNPQTGQPSGAKQQLRDLLQNKNNQNNQNSNRMMMQQQQQQQQQIRANQMNQPQMIRPNDCFRPPFPPSQIPVQNRQRIVNPNDHQVFRHPGDNTNRMMMPPRPVDIRSKVVIGQKQIRYQQQQAYNNRMPIQQQPMHLQQPNNQQQQQFMAGNNQMMYANQQQSPYIRLQQDPTQQMMMNENVEQNMQLKNALQHNNPLKANDPNMSIAAINNPTNNSQPQQQELKSTSTTHELIKQVQVESPNELVDENLVSDDVEDDDLFNFDSDFNILEYADPELGKSLGSNGGKKSNIFDEHFDELLDKEDSEKDKSKSKDATQQIPTASSHPSSSALNHQLPPPYPGQTTTVSNQQTVPTTDNDLMNLLNDSDLEKLRDDICLDDLITNPTLQSDKPNTSSSTTGTYYQPQPQIVTATTISQQPPQIQQQWQQSPQQTNNNMMTYSNMPPQNAINNMQQQQQQQQQYQIRPPAVNQNQQMNMNMNRTMNVPMNVNMNNSMPMNRMVMPQQQQMTQQQLNPQLNQQLNQVPPPPSISQPLSPINQQPVVRVASNTNRVNLKYPIYQAPKSPPNEILTEQDRQIQTQYETWLGNKEIALDENKKQLDGEIAELRKRKKNYTTKQRQAKKNGNELSEQDQIDMNQLGDEIKSFQKAIDNIKSQIKQHGRAKEDFVNKKAKQQQHLMNTNQSLVNSTPHSPAPLMSPASRHNASPSLHSPSLHSPASSLQHSPASLMPPVSPMIQTANHYPPQQNSPHINMNNTPPTGVVDNSSNRSQMIHHPQSMTTQTVDEHQFNRMNQPNNNQMYYSSNASFNQNQQMNMNYNQQPQTQIRQTPPPPLNPINQQQQFILQNQSPQQQQQFYLQNMQQVPIQPQNRASPHQNIQPQQKQPIKINQISNQGPIGQIQRNMPPPPPYASSPYANQPNVSILYRQL